MIFDGYAAALPLIASDIDYVKERAREERAALELPRNQPEVAAERLAAALRERAALLSLAQAAHRAAAHHCAEAWYTRRAEWTIDAYERHQSGIGSSNPALKSTTP
jgi:hypothetical protein